MSLMNFRSDPSDPSVVEHGKTPLSYVLAEKELKEKTAWRKGVAQKQVGIQQAQEKRESAKHPWEMSAMARSGILGWSSILKSVLVIAGLLFLFVGGFSASAAIIEFIAENFWFDLIALIIILWWIRR